ncbi:hypothetical protein AADG42_14065 [Ammonicoccus fulvus]|uniref:Uncharacterized protein n=1 Tax=Ammonicoccus fulvus TaxID=3138240 RepID=A0ABZ3FQN5_9ACTN
MSPYIGGMIVGALGLVFGLIAGNEKLRSARPTFARRFSTIGAFVLLAAFLGLFLLPLVMGWGR